MQTRTSDDPVIVGCPNLSWRLLVWPGNNLVEPEKKLKKDALEKYGVTDVTKIKAIIAGGQGAMPAIGVALDAKEIDDVANYVFTQSQKGW
mmetsp:Transcript_74299/g.229610  ORF Transcript_74299/g.229610 Transcript_74299/m.229610 type:complete len:91 (+) Transcript_74299:121-393(+)